MTAKNMIAKASAFAEVKHRGQLDDNGKPYIIHPRDVADILHRVGADDATICAALLHDTLEDTTTTHDELVAEFGSEIADLVHEVTHEGQKDNYGFYFPRLHSHRAIMIKFADTLSNLSRMDSWPEKRKQQFLRRVKFWRDGKDKEVKVE